jgi:ferredoxin
MMKLKAVHEYCSGCGVCRLACALENFREMNPSLAALRIEGRFPAPGDFRIDLCDQCGLCAEVCPEEAISAVNGVYRIDQDACTGCLTCVDACPNHVLMAHKALETPFKCTLCGVCAALCPRGALVLVEGDE